MSVPPIDPIFESVIVPGAKSDGVRAFFDPKSFSRSSSCEISRIDLDCTFLTLGTRRLFYDIKIM